jgi:hypothetical protein
MRDHSNQQLTTREMVRAHAYPVPIARQADHMNRCLAGPASPGCQRFR